MVSALDKVELTMAMGYYEHTADLTTGRVPVEGVSLRCLDLPAEEIFYRFTRVGDRCLNDMLLDGSIDAVLSARPPHSFSLGDLRIARLIADPAAAEEEYARRAGIVPIMHLVVLRRDVADAHPWIAGNLMTAFEEARARSLTRLGAGPAGPGSRVPLLWTDGALARTREVFGCKPWPYGVEANRRTLDAFARWAQEQGVTRRLVAVDEMFPESLRSPSRI
jgi:4,5-dihydroxyphthalate decarboxylase